MEKIVVDFEVKSKGAEKSVTSLTNEVKELNENVTNTNKQAESGLKGVKKGADGASTGFKGMGVALKAAGIGLVLSLLSKLAEVFNKNQKVADVFATVFEGISIVFNDFVNFIIDNSGNVVSFFKDIFENPLENIKKLGKSIQDNIVERFESFLDTLGFLASAVKKVFSGDFAGALEDVKNAGKESLDVLTGVNNVFDKGKKIIEDGASAIANYTKEVVKSAKENVNLANSAELASAQQSLLIEKYDIQAEKLRQIRDEERNSIADRIKANNDLKEVLENQEKAMLKQAELQIASAQANLNKNNSIENQVALTDALANKEGVLAQIQGFRSEQLANDLALDKEKIELTKSKEESESKLSIERKRFNAEQIEDELLKLEKLREIDEQERILETERLQLLIDNANAGTQAKIDAEIAFAEFQEEARQLKIERDKEIEEANLERKKELADKENDLEAKKVKAKEDAFNAIQNIAGAETKLGKALLVAKQLLAVKEMVMEAKKTITFASLATAKSSVALAEGTAQTAKVGFPQNIPLLIGYGIQAVGIVSALRSAVGKSNGISSSLGGGGGASAPTSAPSTPSTPPAFNVVGASGSSQLADAIGSQSQKPVKAFVVSNDVTTAQSMDRNIVDSASI